MGKKTSEKGGFHREIVEGPYKKKEAEEEAKSWKLYFKYEDKITAEVFTFYSLCCNFEIEIEKKNYLYEEHIWQPPIGTELFCLIYQPERILVKERKSLDNNTFEKFYNYVKNENIDSFEIYNYIIFYNSKNYKSIIGARVAKRIIIDFISLKRERNILLTYLIDNKLENDFIVIPEYVKEYKRSCYFLLLSSFKEYLDIKNCNKRLANFYDKIYKCLPQENLHLYDDTITLDFYLLLNNRDYQAKIFKLNKHNKGYDLTIGNEENYIKLININNCQAELKVKLNLEEDFIEEFAQGDKKFQETENYLGLLIYIAKCFGIKTIKFNGDQEVSCICDNSNSMLYQELIYLLADKKSIYQKIGFKNSNNIDKKIANFRSMTVAQILGQEDNEEDPFLQKDLQEVAQLYLQAICNYEYGCSLMTSINTALYPQIKKDLKYELKVDNKDLKFWRSLF